MPFVVYYVSCNIQDYNNLIYAMRRSLSCREDLKRPGAKWSRYSSKKIFTPSYIARDGPNRVSGKPLPIARRLIEGSIQEINFGDTRVFAICNI